ncbi:MAG: T9SS type A sorting domain-containing protein, partial [Bacteroidales bacterium]|nr:T9SS type A sorting domain-containing protein [Bacteroidales bacterium]
NNAGRFFNVLTAVTGEFTSTGHTEAGGYPASPAPTPAPSMVANNRKAGSGDDLGAVKWQDYSLPIELLSFVGSCQNGVTTFNWETMTETNNDYFTIEASRDAVNYEAIAKISGAGTTSQKQQYSYHINTNDGMMYYRLRQTDIDGQTEVFAPIAVQCTDSKSEEPNINIYPQPAENMFEINVQGEGVEIEQMSLYNMVGSCIKRQVVNGRTAAMSLETLSSGVYNLLIRLSDGKLYNKKVVVTK